MSAYWVTRKTKDGRTRYHVTYRLPGQKRRLHWGVFGSKKAADAAVVHIETEIAQGRAPRAAVAPPPPLRVREGVEAELDRPGRSRSAEKRTRQTLATLGPLGEMDVLHVRPSHLRAWIDSMADKAPSTAAQYLREIRRMLEHADLPHANPAKHSTVKVGRPVAKPHPDAVSYREFADLVEEITPRFKFAITFLERTGLRVRELQALTWGDVDIAGGRIRVGQGKTDAARRWVPLTESLAEALGNLLPLEDRMGCVFLGFAVSSFDQAMRRAARRLGQPVYSAHDLRHRYASLLVLAGVPVELTKQILGHHSSEVTLGTYGHVLLDEPTWRLQELKEAVGRMAGFTSDREREEVG